MSFSICLLSFLSTLSSWTSSIFTAPQVFVLFFFHLNIIHSDDSERSRRGFFTVFGRKPKQRRSYNYRIAPYRTNNLTCGAVQTICQLSLITRTICLFDWYFLGEYRKYRSESLFYNRKIAVMLRFQHNFVSFQIENKPYQKARVINVSGPTA